MPITQELKDRWLARLESPEAKWAGGILHNTDTGGMCCLGHLADIVGAWDDESHTEVCGEDGEPPAPFCGLTLKEMHLLIDFNDGQEAFPIDLIRTLPVETTDAE